MVIIPRWFREGSTEPITNNQHYQISHFAHDDEYVDTILRSTMMMMMVLVVMVVMMMMKMVMLMLMLMMVKLMMILIQGDHH